MRAKIAFLLVLAICIGVSVKAQSLYFIKYQFTTIEDTTTYFVFLVRQEDGTGFYRVRFYDPESRLQTCIDLDMKEEFAKDPNGNEDQTKLYFKGYNPKVIFGDPNYHYYPERFWFRLDSRTGLYEPWGVTSPDEGGTAQGKFITPPQLLQERDLTERFVGSYFKKDEEIYQALFATTQRGLTFEQRQAQLHLIVVANTKDITIGNTCVVDRDRTVKMYHDLAEFLQIGFDPKVISDNNFSKANVENTVANLNPGPRDIVIFYYSGHGFRDPDNSKQFPRLALINADYQSIVENSVNIEDIYNLIKRKGARFNLVISDCCNNGEDDRNEISCDVPQTRSSAIGWSLENCKALFMSDKPMSILTTAAQKGELSSGNLADGGYFTNQFRTNLTSYFKPFYKFPTWNLVLDDARKTTIETASNGGCGRSINGQQKTLKQHPVWRIQQ